MKKQLKDRIQNKNQKVSFSSLIPKDDDKNKQPAVPPTSDVVVPINFDTSSSVKGEESQILEVDLEPNQVLRAESGAMIYMTQGVEMSTSLGGTGNTGPSISDGFKRMLTGQNLFISDYAYHGPEGSVGTVALGTDFPSKIIRLSLKEYGNKIVCQKSAYLASDLNVDIQMEFAKKFTAGFFGGEGFILQGLIGDGDVFVKAGGTLVKKELQEGETLRISSGSLVAFTQDVEYDVQTMPGFKNVLFGGEGLFVTTLTGPGTIWLQGMPPDRMISEIARRVPSGGGVGLGIPIGMGGGGGSTGEEEGAVAGDDEGTEGAEDLVASTDASIEADRNATVASSGLYGSSDDDLDSESSSALFGDASPQQPSSNIQDGGVGMEESSHFSSSDDDTSSSTMPDLDDSTSFSNDETDFGDDLTNNDQFDDFEQDSTTFSSEGGGVGEDAGDGDSGDSVLSSLWDMFFNDD